MKRICKVAILILLCTSHAQAGNRYLWVEPDSKQVQGAIYDKPWSYDKDDKKTTPRVVQQETVHIKSFTNSIGMKLVWVAPGSFIMGSSNREKGRWVDEGPAHERIVSQGFWMGAHEVTQDEYLSVMGENPSAFKGLKRPVERLTWLDALTFCHKLTVMERMRGNLSKEQYYTLPKEEQWEFACRAGSQKAFNTGDTITTAEANFNGEHPYGNAPYGRFLRETVPVGTYACNSLGLYDMHGNVDEYCLDTWSEKKRVSHTSPEVKWVAVRGGSCMSLAAHCRSARRDRYGPNTRCCDRGFRVVVANGK